MNIIGIKLITYNQWAWDLKLAGKKPNKRNDVNELLTNNKFTLLADIPTDIKTTPRNTVIEYFDKVNIDGILEIVYYVNPELKSLKIYIRKEDGEVNTG